MPGALRELDDAELVGRLARTSFAVFLDYDGTLTAIAARPELATLAEEQRSRLRALAARHPVAIVTGRGMADIRRLVGLPGLHYAANHGFEISGPDVAFEVDPTLRSTFAAVAAELERRVSTIPNIILESKGYSVAVHYRLSPGQYVPDIESAVDATVAHTEGVRKSTGKCVFEIRPELDWHKGAAVEWLSDRFGTQESIYIGDDRTDEDAFEAVKRARGIAIVVGEPEWPTAADWCLRDHESVGRLLGRLARL